MAEQCFSCAARGKGVLKVADFLVANDRLGHRSGQTLRYLLLSVWMVCLGRQGGMVV